MENAAPQKHFNRRTIAIMDGIIIYGSAIWAVMGAVDRSQQFMSETIREFMFVQQSGMPRMLHGNRFSK